MKIWWLLDDVFNELDTLREKVFLEKVLNDTDFYIITGTKELDLDIATFKVGQLLASK
ncbi:hypothetical protein HC864_01335 [Candidatus Gracilibacteria bacterium]|nr:hypothetical protein [Candidatus Gracilibacteria bacterium]